VPGPALAELTIADEPATWAALGFAVGDDGVCRVGGVRLRLAGSDAGRGIVRWSLSGLASTELDGLPTARAEDGAAAPPDRRAAQAAAAAPGEPPVRAAPLAAAPGDPPALPLGVVALDHVVAVSPRLDRTVQALQQAGLDLRRIREEPTPAGAPRQAFFRVGAAILEVIQEPDDVVERHGGPDRPAFFWGLALVAEDLDAVVERLGEHAGPIRPAVQPGRRIAPLRRAAGLALSVALMTPQPPSKV
jgi:glyoxalase/bleomycin resistance protein/dioxygenase superfamily protein